MSVIASRTSDGLVLTSWYAAPNHGSPTIVLFHGNAGSLAGRAFKARHFLDEGYGVLLVGYRGFGDNPGKPTEQGLYMDARSALRHVFDDGVTPDKTVLYGESLGSGIAVQMAWEQANATSTARIAEDEEDRRRIPYAAVVLEAPFTSMGDAAAGHYPWLPARYLVKDRYDSISKIGQVSAPLFIVHGGNDRTVPQEHGRILYSAAQEPKDAYWIPQARHVDVYEFGAGEEIVKWLKTLN